MIDPERRDAGYTFGSALLTIIIGALAFITALAWNDLVRESFQRLSPKQEMNAKISYAVLVTAAAIILGFILMFYVPGHKW